ncbi:hypothetical protein OU798_08470 [Prolixibacteraceae bacterium Z1-6]|uniref:Glycosyltransferase RgtA/B/C/D-like domain-containing protein n=1 Tax=Draconibacterium aestuarii TaxID=2998507 RepID=A0A9X3J5G2_9BACT|nr:hypothetical protein [Prolixibacteraceae bacterium Z1-6]
MNLFKKRAFSNIVIAIFLVIITMVNFSHHKYKSKEGVIDWDIKSYYAYLPATFIYHDLSLGFLDHNEHDMGKWIWPVSTPTGKRAILTTMGLSFLYAPFFLVGHIAALLLPQYEATGYSLPYHITLQFSVLVYFLISLIVLRKILSRYFEDKVVALTLFTIGAGTNLFYYLTYSAPMTHGYNFFLIVLFIYFLEKWHNRINWKYTICLGLVSGLVTLIRPTNILVLLLIPLWHISTWNEFKDQVIRLLKYWPYIGLMAGVFILVWVPQFVYWKYVSDKFFYFSYGERGDQFYWENPQIWKILFSYEKGWFVYTPLMFVVFFGFKSLKKLKINLSLPIIIYLTIMIYVLASWWCWWYGGSFGQRSFVDFYGLMAIPLGAVIHTSLQRKYLKYVFPLFLFVLIAFNQFNIQQFNRMAISYWWMNKEGYWENFLKLHPTCKYWNVAMHPDYDKARLGIYEAVAPFNRAQVVTDEMLVDRIVNDNKNNSVLLDSLQVYTPDIIEPDSVLLNNYARLVVTNELAESYFKEIKIDYYYNQINNCEDWKRQVDKKAQKRELSYEKMAKMEAERIYKNYSQKYDQR